MLIIDVTFLISFNINGLKQLKFIVVNQIYGDVNKYVEWYK
jgi:hypothetical protein